MLQDRFSLPDPAEVAKEQDNFSLPEPMEVVEDPDSVDLLQSVEDQTTMRNFTMVESGDGYVVVSWNEFEGWASVLYYTELLYISAGGDIVHEEFLYGFEAYGNETRHRLDLEPGIIHEGKLITF